MIVDVGAVEDFAEPSMTVVPGTEKPVGVVRWQGRFYAMRNLCPHLNAPVCGQLKGVLSADAEFLPELDNTVPVVSCTWHRWEFDLATGKCRHDDRLRLVMFPVNLQEGRVLVDIPS